MFSRAHAVALAAIMIVLMVGANTVAAASASGSTSRVASLRHGIVWQRSSTWRFQDRAGTPRTPTVYAERRSRSLPFLRWIEHRWAQRRLAARHRLAQIGSGSVPVIICRVFGAAQCQEALYIAKRESGFETWATNGQYVGLFQLGSGERATYATIGYSSAYEQTVAAHNLFEARGWEPWTCCE